MMCIIPQLANQGIFECLAGCEGNESEVPPPGALLCHVKATGGLLLVLDCPEPGQLDAIAGHPALQLLRKQTGRCLCCPRPL